MRIRKGGGLTRMMSTSSTSWSSNNTNNRDVRSIPKGDRLRGRVCIVTGAGTYIPGLGNGMSAATLFALQGAHVVVVDKKLQRMEETLAMIREHAGTEALAVEADLTLTEDCQRVVDATVAAHQRVDVLVNNVGRVGQMGRIETITKEGFENTMSQNVTSMFLMSKLVLPHMKGGGQSSIINVSSVRGVRGAVGLIPYCVSKGAVEMLTETLALEVGPRGIRVNGINLGMVTTPLVDEAFTLSARSPEEREEVLGRLHRHRNAQLSLMRQQGDGWDLAYAALFLASDESRFMHGSHLFVDGGHNLGNDDETEFIG